MDTKEVNDIPYDNLAISFNNSPENIALGDELAAPENYADEAVVTRYAKSKRKIRIAKIAFMSVTITATGGALITTILPQLSLINVPQLTSKNFEVKNNHLIYSFAVSNTKNNDVVYTIENNGQEIYKVNINTDGSYANSYNLGTYVGDFIAEISYKDLNNNKQSLYSFKFIK